MATNNVLGTVYDTLLCSPGMSEAVKIDVKIMRKTVLLMSSIVESCLKAEGETTNELLKFVPKEDTEQLRLFCEECLNKAGLAVLSEKIKSLGNDK
ncbi:hypothetical protein [Mucilaginibacter sp. UYCu711]|uniref:hypothetical protein n=1 Tax=Mucilaginibacter sp. UYCu711 TaxID=3156339 RepID=UPI003D1EC08F